MERNRPAPLADTDVAPIRPTAPAVFVEAAACESNDAGKPVQSVPVRNTFIDFKEHAQVAVPISAPGKFVGRLSGSAYGPVGVAVSIPPTPIMSPASVGEVPMAGPWPQGYNVVPVGALRPTVVARHLAPALPAQAPIAAAGVSMPPLLSPHLPPQYVPSAAKDIPPPPLASPAAARMPAAAFTAPAPPAVAAASACTAAPGGGSPVRPTLATPAPGAPLTIPVAAPCGAPGAAARPDASARSAGAGSPHLAGVVGAAACGSPQMTVVSTAVPAPVNGGSPGGLPSQFSPPGWAPLLLPMGQPLAQGSVIPVTSVAQGNSPPRFAPPAFALPTMSPNGAQAGVVPPPPAHGAQAGAAPPAPADWPSTPF